MLNFLTIYFIGHVFLHHSFSCIMVVLTISNVWMHLMLSLFMSWLTLDGWMPLAFAGMGWTRQSMAVRSLYPIKTV